jgi:hypothetical protein
MLVPTRIQHEIVVATLDAAHLGRVAARSPIAVATSLDAWRPSCVHS